MILFILSFSVYADNSSVAFLYGYGTLSDGKKDAENISPAGQSYKFLLGRRVKEIQLDVLIRYVSLADDLRYQDVRGELTHHSLSFGGQLGFWILPWLQPHVGYAYHAITEKVNGNFNSVQQTEMKSKFHLMETSTAGLFGGVDLVLLGSKKVQLFANYDYYHFNRLHSHDWEMMVGLRFYTDPPKTKEEFGQSLFNSLLRALFKMD